MKMLQYMERAWLLAAVAAAVLCLYNGFRYQSLLNTSVYFPAFCAVFCVLIFYNIRRQRLFREEMLKEEEQKQSAE